MPAVRRTRVSMFGEGPVRRELDAELARRGFELTGEEDADLVVHCAAPGEPDQAFIRVDGACGRAGVPCLHVAVESGRILVGPLFVPGRTACFLCSRSFVRCLEGDSAEDDGPLAPWMIALAATAAADEIDAFLAGGAAFRMASHVVVSGYRRGSSHRNLLDSTHTPTTAACAICRAPARADITGPALPCFIVGSQRSGTTMLGLALGAHPEIELFDEDRAYAALAGHPLPHGAVLKVPRWTAAVSFFAAHFPSAGFLFLRRPAHQVVASMLSLRGFAGASWADLFAAIEARVAAAGFTSPPVRAVIERHIRAASDPVLRATVCAVVKQELVSEYRRAGLRALEVDYERLVRDPAATLAGLLDFLGLPWSDAVLDPGRRSGAGGTTVGQTERGRAIDAGSLDKHTRVLGDGGLERVRRLEEELLADLARARETDA